MIGAPASVAAAEQSRSPRIPLPVKAGRVAMGWIIALIVGGIAGWLASMVMGRNASMGIFLNIVVGCVGSVIGNWLSGPLFGVRGSVQEFSLTGLIIAFVGAVVLLGIFNLVQRKSIR
jgi:uncharacterized membrane protein YeaQ/YmgE (transglycosylase-associated protein family)